MSICPICAQEVAPRSTNKAHPFCTARCKMIDLGKWLSEDYRVSVPGEGDEVEDEVEALDSPTKTDMRH